MSDIPTLYLWPKSFWGWAWNRYLLHRARKGKIDPSRIDEYRGISSIERPTGDIVWIHGVSVGESASSLPLIRALRHAYPQMPILLTTTTKTSAQTVAADLPEGVMHQYLPVDHQPWVARFFEFWSPVMGIWLESELWPNLCTQADRRGVARVLLNGRVSPKSQNRWSFMPRLIRRILRGFRVIHVQQPQQLGFFHSLDATHAKMGVDLKNAASPLPHDPDLLAQWHQRLQHRPYWLATSTHHGEEEIICAAHEILREEHPDLLCIIVPRHPERGASLQQSLQAQSGFQVQVASRDEYTPQSDIFLADAMGQLGAFYRLAPFAFIGGSLVARGGHNMREAILLHCMPIVGPHLENFSRQKAYFADALVMVQDAESLAHAVKRKLASPQTVERKAMVAAEAAEEMKQGVIEEILQDFAPLLGNQA